MTSGAPDGTNGKRSVWFGPWVALASVGLVVALVNAASKLAEWQRAGTPLGTAFEPFLWELSSLAVVLALAPLVGRAIARWPIAPNPGLRNIVIHVALTIPFSLTHVLLMLAARLAVYGLLGQRYDFFGNDPAATFLYEWRKDALTYALIACVYWLFTRLQADDSPSVRASTPDDDRIAVKDGARTVFVRARDILTVEAAGNYVELKTAVDTQLVRGVLNEWEARLKPFGFVRVHRSRLVNRARVVVIRPTASGDFMIELDTGTSLLGSRRYRLASEQPAGTT